MASHIYKKIIELVTEASRLAHSLGISNLLQPGLVKEMIIADLLGHELIYSKRDADAHAPNNPDEKYEYLSCKEGGSGQIDRVFARPLNKREKSLERITRNRKFYFAVFYGQNQMKCKVIFEIEVENVLREANRQLDNSTNQISHISFSIDWAKNNGKVVYQDDSGA